MRILEKSLRFFLVVTLAAFCWTVANADTWNEVIDGGGDAGDFPAGDFQMAPDNSVVYDVITGDNGALSGGSPIDSYLILVTDADNFYINDSSGDVSDTQAFCWDMGGNPIWANDDDPNHVGDGDFSFGFGNGSAHPGDIVGAPSDLSNGDTFVLSIGAFGDTADGDAGGTVFLADAGDFISLRAPTGEGFVSYNAAGAGAYNIVLQGAQLAGEVTKGCDNPVGDLNGDQVVDLLDVNPFVDAVLAGTFVCEADVNEDEVVDLLDVNPFVALILGG